MLISGTRLVGEIDNQDVTLMHVFRRRFAPHYTPRSRCFPTSLPSSRTIRRTARSSATLASLGRAPNLPLTTFKHIPFHGYVTETSPPVLSADEGWVMHPVPGWRVGAPTLPKGRSHSGRVRAGGTLVHARGAPPHAGRRGERA